MRPDDGFGPTEAFRSILPCLVIPRQKLVDLALFVPVDDGGEGGCQIGLRIDSVEFAGLCRPSNYAERAGLCQRFS